MMFNVIFTCSYNELCEKFRVEYIPGGATQNSAKIAQVKYENCNTIIIV